MEFRLNSHYFLQETNFNSDGNRSQAQTQESKKTQKNIQKENTFKSFEANSTDLIANYSKAGIRLSKHNRENLPDGLSEYRYKDSKYTVYKRGDRYKSEFIGRRGVDKSEFFRHFDELKRLEKTLNRTKYTSNSAIDDVNGKIDGQVIQGNTGDCWLLTALTSMSSTETGRKIIADSITVNDDNTVTVAFKGIGVSYTITANEIEKHDTDNNTYDSYSNGDNDALVFELAVEKLWQDINLGKVFLNTNDEDITFTGYSIDEGGLPTQLIYYLTGIESNEYYNDDLCSLSKSTVYEILENALKNGSTAINFGIYYDEHSAKLIDGSLYSIDVGDGGHALAVTNITSDTVTFVNPWDSNVEYTMSWSEFANLGIGYISSADLTKANYTPEITDMSGDSKTYNDDFYYSDFYYNDYDYNDYYYNYDYDFEPLTPKYDDYFRPEPYVNPYDNWNIYDDNRYSDYGNNYGGYYSYNSYSFTDFLYEFLNYFISYFARYN